MLSTENCYLLNHPPLITYLDCVQHFTSHGVGVFLAHVFLHMYDYFCRAVSYSSESEGSIHIKHFDRTGHVILPKGCTIVTLISMVYKGVFSSLSLLTLGFIHPGLYSIWLTQSSISFYFAFSSLFVNLSFFSWLISSMNCQHLLVAAHVFCPLLC